MKSKSAEKIKLTSYDDLFGSSEVTAEEKIVSLGNTSMLLLSLIHI